MASGTYFVLANTNVSLPLSQWKRVATNLLSVSGSFTLIVTNAAGCGSTLKEYDELLESDSEYRDRAHRFAAKVKDVTEFLAELGLRVGERIDLARQRLGHFVEQRFDRPALAIQLGHHDRG